jgi:hypothetical protein
MRRALAVRDGSCRFPGCERRHYVDGHHIIPWSQGGETKLDNLVLLCRHHHRLVHEGGFSVDWGPAGPLHTGTGESMDLASCVDAVLAATSS